MGYVFGLEFLDQFQYGGEGGVLLEGVFEDVGYGVNEALAGEHHLMEVLVQMRLLDEVFGLADLDEVVDVVVDFVQIDFVVEIQITKVNLIHHLIHRQLITT